jgi:hypothetical protein
LFSMWREGRHEGSAPHLRKHTMRIGINVSMSFDQESRHA